MTIAMIASEANPLCKTGGLADVVWSLTKELKNLGQDCFVVLPFYKCIKETPTLLFKKLKSYDVYLSWRCQTADVFSCEVRGVTFYLIGNDYYFNREDLYGYADDGERFAFYCLAVRALFGQLDLPCDIIHVHDWQTGMIPVLIKEQSKDDPRFQHTKFVMTLHNEAFKGFLDRYFVNHFFGLDDSLFDSGAIRFDGMLSTLKAGIVYADKVVAVSPNHANELLQPGDSMRLDGVLALREGDFLGIVNGVDDDEFDPENDMFIAKNYGHRDFTEGKAQCKARLLSVCELKGDGPTFGLVSRLTYQKGVEMVLRIGDELVSKGARLVILGHGECEIEQGFEELHLRHPDRCLYYRGYNNQLAHDIYSGSDFFLMPSLFEPCGIGQMIAQRYGTLPIVREVGGLKDTVIGYDGKNEDTATGFSFTDYDFGRFRDSCLQALSLYSETKTFAKLVHNAMTVDHSWARSAMAYLGLYQSIL
ncbi:MAG: glycogen synthase [Bacilli bacterium]|nr:glycogen synthase [Bacilli bacterium]